ERRGAGTASQRPRQVTHERGDRSRRVGRGGARAALARSAAGRGSLVSVAASRIFQRAARLDFLDGFGVSIGRQHVALPHLVKRLASVWLQGYRLLPLPGPERPDHRRSALADAVRDFVMEFSVDTDRTYLSLPRANALLSRLSLPVAAKDDLRQVVEFEI